MWSLKKLGSLTSAQTDRPKDNKTKEQGMILFIKIFDIS